MSSTPAGSSAASTSPPSMRVLTPGEAPPPRPSPGAGAHKDIHVAAVIGAVGALAGTRDFPATAAGYRALLTRARTFGAVLRAGVEGTSSYGAALNRMLRREDVTVIEAGRPDRADRRRRGKSDATDAEAAARARAVRQGHSRR